MLLKVDFVDFWPGFNRSNNYFMDVLKKIFDTEISNNPDVLFHSIFGRSHWKYNCLKILVCGENYRPNLFESDYVIGFDYIKSHRCFRWPVYKYHGKPEFWPNLGSRSRFCCAVISNPTGVFRNYFIKNLMERRRVDLGGKYLNNVGGSVSNKFEFISNYKFSIAFENRCYPGYTTEKIIDSKFAGAIPIYFGNPRIYEEFQRGSFINLHDFVSVEACIDYILEVDSNINLYNQIQSTPLVPHNRKDKLMWYRRT